MNKYQSIYIFIQTQKMIQKNTNNIDAKLHTHTHIQKDIRTNTNKHSCTPLSNTHSPKWHKNTPSTHNHL